MTNHYLESFESSRHESKDSAADNLLTITAHFGAPVHQPTQMALRVSGNSNGPLLSESRHGGDGGTPLQYAGPARMTSWDALCGTGKSLGAGEERPSGERARGYEPEAGKMWGRSQLPSPPNRMLAAIGLAASGRANALKCPRPAAGGS